MSRRSPSACSLAAIFTAMALLALADAGRSQHSGTPSSEWPGAELFTNSVIREIQITLTPEAAASLRQYPRDHVRATVTHDGTTWSNVGVHLKGATGSFRALDDKPSLTLDFSRFERGQQFYQLRKIHLNNSVEDPAYANEVIGSEMFRAAGVPAPRVTRSLVKLNDRKLGLYVVKEGFTEDFLSCHFQRVSGELYEPEDGGDVERRMDRKSVLAPAGSRAPLRQLAIAAQEADLNKRWQDLETVLDTDRFATFLCLEVMLGHRDGYCMARNNFRVYQDLDTDRILFFPHGMDQLFGTPDLTWQPALGGLVARAWMETPQGKQLYADRFAGLLSKVFNLELLTNRVDELVADLRPVLAPGDWKQIRDEAALVKARMMQRHASLEWQLAQPPLTPIAFAAGSAILKGWRMVDTPLQGRMDRTNSPDGLPALHISTSAATAASWRATALVPRGRYRFEGRVRIASVQPLPYGEHHGAGLRVRGFSRQSGSFIGDSSWRVLALDIQIEQATEEVEFICELRARAGEAWFEADSLRLVQMGDL